ncbi:MAG TPA: hypothetical protein DE117_06800 [Fervidobacterium sp.]|nr:hypothetical protein [Fervidobacterium sp.]
MFLKISVSDKSRKDWSGEYYYAVELNDEIIIEGRVKNVHLKECWTKLVQELFKETLVSTSPAPAEEEPLHMPSPIALEKQQDRYLTAKETSFITGISLGTLANNRSARKGIPYVKISDRSVRYKLSDVLAYMNHNRIDPQQLRNRLSHK